MTSAGPTDSPPRVLVVDADDRIRESLTGLLGIGRRCVVVGSAGRTDEALDLAATLDPDVVLVDPRLPEIDEGRRFLVQLRRLAPTVRIVVMGWSDAVEPGALGDEADAFVRKTFRPRELVDAVRPNGHG